MSEWISVKDRLPEDNYNLYLVWREGRSVNLIIDICEFTNDIWYSYDGACNPTHWMPLPQPPDNHAPSGCDPTGRNIESEPGQ